MNDSFNDTVITVHFLMAGGYKLQCISMSALSNEK